MVDIVSSRWGSRLGDRFVLFAGAYGPIIVAVLCPDAPRHVRSAHLARCVLRRRQARDFAHPPHSCLAPAVVALLRIVRPDRAR